MTPDPVPNTARKVGTAKVLVCYFFGSRTIPLGGSFVRALQSLGCNVDTFDLRVQSPVNRYLFRYSSKLIRTFTGMRVKFGEHSRYNPLNYRQHQLERKIAAFRPDVVLNMMGKELDPKFLRGLKQKYGISKIVGWWIAGPKWLDTMYEQAEGCDYVFCMHKIREEGRRELEYLSAIAVDRTLYHPPADPERPASRKILFLGSYNDRRRELLEGICDLPVEIHGNGWYRKTWSKPRLFRRVKSTGVWEDGAVAALYNSSDIILNISAWDPSQGDGGLNLRILDVPACRAFLLTDYSPEVSDYLEIGKEVETFRDAAELRQKLTYYLSEPGARRQIAQRGYERTFKHQTYVDKMAHVLLRAGFAVGSKT